MSRILLAPMEGLADSLLRDLLTRVGGYDAVVSEFVRVSSTSLPLRTFRRVCPELGNGSRTPAGTPVIVQLLGSDPQRMAETASRLASLAPAGIDLNFGCPAPTVNRHGGGAMLLAHPGLMERIARSVRCAVPVAIPVSAKMRLGIDDTQKTLECAQALEAGGIDVLVVHARTKNEWYRPPAHWEWIARVRETVSIPVVANGEIWSVGDYLRCRSISGCEDVMLGRGAVADPFLAGRIRAECCGKRGELSPCAEWHDLGVLLMEFWHSVQQRVSGPHAPGRLKLWLNLLRRAYPQAEALYQRVRGLGGVDEVRRLLDGEGFAPNPPMRLKD